MEEWIHIHAINEYFHCRSKVLRVSPLTQGEHLHLIYRDGIPIGVSTKAKP